MPPPSACSSCNSNFSLFKRRNKCRWCLRTFCAACLLKEKICERCDLIFNHPMKENLMKLKTKELMFYLDLLKITSTNCVEKEELVNLIIINVTKMKPSQSNSSSGGGARSFDDINANFEHIRNRCQNLFTNFSDRMKSGDASTRQTPSNSSSFYTFPDNDVRENRQSYSKQSSVDNGSRNGDDVQSTSEKSPVPPQPSTSKSFSVSHRANSNHHRQQASRKMRNSHQNHIPHVVAAPTAILKVDQQLGRPRSNSDSNLIEKIHNESSLLNVPKKSSCENCEKTRTKVKLKLCHALQLMEKIEPNEESAIADVKEILSDTIESIDHVTSYSIQSSPSSSSLDSSLSIIPMPESGALDGDRNDRGSDTTLGMNQEDACSLDTRQDVSNNSTVENNNDEAPQQVEPTFIEFDRQNSLTLSPIESPVMAPQFNLPPKRFFTLDDVKSKEELDDLTVKQLKEILTINRVNFKGCCEKNELKERVLRLWDDHVSSLPIEKLPNEDLCKICFSSSVSCAFLECGHSCTCIDCGKVLNECPVCRQYIIRVLRIFKS